MIKVFYDLETTGTDPRKHSIHQIAGYIEENGLVIDEFNIKTAPHPKAEITPEAMKICGVTEEQIRKYTPMAESYKTLAAIIREYVDDFDPKDKIHLIGFNNRFFDDQFLRAWFKQNKSSMFANWFWPDTLDVMVLASQYLLKERPNMPSFKLHRVAKTFGLDVVDAELHDALYDVYLTREIYNLITL